MQLAAIVEFAITVRSSQYINALIFNYSKIPENAIVFGILCPDFDQAMVLVYPEIEAIVAH